MAPLTTLETLHGHDLEAFLARTWHRVDVAPAFMPPTAMAADVEALAQVNDHRWIVRCPFCNGAQLAHRTDRRFFCVDCLSAPAGGRWVKVTWPANTASIDAILSQRPAAGQWKPGEPVVALVAENIAAGHTVPEPVMKSLQDGPFGKALGGLGQLLGSR
jgi:hypothetical protein